MDTRTLRRSLTLTLVLSSACTLPPLASQQLSTGEIVPDIRVETTIEGSVVEVRLREASTLFRTPVYLDAGDSLLAQVDGVVYEFEPMPESDKQEPAYVTEVPVARGGAWIQVSLQRDSDESARYSGIVLPESFGFYTPRPEDMLSRSDDAITVRYGNGERPDDVNALDGSMALELVGDCVAPITMDDLPDFGWFELPAESITGGGTCVAQLTLSRTGTEGVLDASFGEGGSIVAVQKRRVSFWTAP